MSNNTKSIKATTPTPSRRTIVKGAAWAVPAIAVAGATPAFAVSPECLTFTLDPTACKWPGQSTGLSWGYKFQLCVTSTCEDVSSVTITKLAASGQSGKTIDPCNFEFPETITLSGGYGCLPVSNYQGDASGNWITIWGYTNNSGIEVELGQVAAPVQLCSGEQPTCA